MFRAYIDDAGTHASSGITGVAAVIAPEERWNAFEVEWAAKLRQPLAGKPPLAKFHMSSCRAHAGEFFGYSPAEVDALTHDLRQIMLNCHVISTAAAVDRTAWDRLVTGSVRVDLGDALQAAFVQCIDRVLSICADREGDGIVQVIIDQGIASPAIERAAELFTLHAGGRPWLRSFRFASVAAELPLQAADMVATETYWHGLQWLRDGANAKARAHFQSWIDGALTEGFLMEAAEIEANVQLRSAGGRS